nr:MAG TPA_asm: hypothetical protein [Caudoviricetes sp.]
MSKSIKAGLNIFYLRKLMTGDDYGLQSSYCSL